jgi:hypothetical protein
MRTWWQRFNWLILVGILLGVGGTMTRAQAATTTGKVLVTYKVADGTVLAQKALTGPVGHHYRTTYKNAQIDSRQYSWNKKQPKKAQGKFTKKTIHVQYKFLSALAFFRLWGKKSLQLTNIQMNGNHQIFDVSTSLKGSGYIQAINFSKGKVTVNGRRLTRGKTYHGKIGKTTFKTLLVSRNQVRATYLVKNKLHTFQFTASSWKWINQ